MKENKAAKIFLIPLSVMLITLFTASTASASEVQKIGGATFIGAYTDSLSLSVDNDSFFQAFITGPGDRWESHINIQNSGKKDLQISFLEIQDKLNDPTLLDALDLRILLNDRKVVYEGKYAATTSPLIEWFTLKAGQEATLTVFTSFPSSCGNDYQAKQFSTDWIFEVRAEEPAAENPQKSTDKPDEPVSEEPVKSNNPSSNQTTGHSNPDSGKSDRTNQNDSSQKESIVLTGDTIPVLLYAVIAVASALAIFGIALATKMNRKGGEIDERQI